MESYIHLERLKLNKDKPGDQNADLERTLEHSLLCKLLMLLGVKNILELCIVEGGCKFKGH